MELSSVACFITTMIVFLRLRGDRVNAVTNKA